MSKGGKVTSKKKTQPNQKWGGVNRQSNGKENTIEIEILKKKQPRLVWERNTSHPQRLLHSSPSLSHPTKTLSNKKALIIRLPSHQQKAASLNEIL